MSGAGRRTAEGSGRDDGHLAVHLVELDDAGLEREERPIAADADILAGVQLAAALADNDGAGEHGLTAENLHPKTLGVAFAPVAG